MSIESLMTVTLSSEITGGPDNDTLWTLRCDLHEINALLGNPPDWVEQVRKGERPGVQVADDVRQRVGLANLKLHPDVTIVFLYPFDQKGTHQSHPFVVEGVTCTNVITVRAPQKLGEDQFQLLLDGPRSSSLINTPAQFSQEAGDVHVAVRPQSGLGYYHYEICKPIANSVNSEKVRNGEDFKNAVLRQALTAIVNPSSFFSSLRQRAKPSPVSQAGSGFGPHTGQVSGEVKVTVINENGTSDMVAAEPQATVNFQGQQRAIKNLRFIYQYTTRDPTTDDWVCTCCKAAGITQPITKGGSGYNLMTDLIWFACYACPQPGPTPIPTPGGQAG